MKTKQPQKKKKKRKRKCIRPPRWVPARNAIHSKSSSRNKPRQPSASFQIIALSKAHTKKLKCCKFSLRFLLIKAAIELKLFRHRLSRKRGKACRLI